MQALVMMSLEHVRNFGSSITRQIDAVIRIIDANSPHKKKRARIGSPKIQTPHDVMCVSFLRPALSSICLIYVAGERTRVTNASVCIHRQNDGCCW